MEGVKRFDGAGSRAGGDPGAAPQGRTGRVKKPRVRYPPPALHVRPPARPPASAPARRAASLLLAALLSACGPSDLDEVRFWAIGREGEVVQALLPEFERRHPGVRVRVQQIPWSAAHEKLLTAFAGGALPDVFQLGNTWIPEFVALGALEALDGRAAASASLVREDFFPGVLATAEIEGLLYGVPWYVDTRLLFYRRDLLARAGLDAPPRSWEEWLAALERLRGAVAPGGHPLLVTLDEWQLPVILAMQRGAELLRDGGRFADFGAAPFREAFAFHVALFERGLAPPAGGAQAVHAHREFAEGRFAMWVTGPWNLGELRRRMPPELDAAWATAPLPAPSVAAAPGLSLAGGAALALRRGSPRLEDAWRLVEFLAEPATQAAFHRLSGDLPARRSAWSDPALAGDPRVEAFRAQLAHVAPTPRIPEWERIAARIVRAAEQVVRGEVDQAEALAALDRDVDALLEKRRWLLARDERRRAAAGAGAAPLAGGAP